MRALCCLTRALLGEKEVCYGDLSPAPVIFVSGILTASNSSLNSSGSATAGPKSKEKESKLVKQELSIKSSIHPSVGLGSHRGSITPSAATPAELIRNTLIADGLCISFKHAENKNGRPGVETMLKLLGGWIFQGSVLAAPKFEIFDETASIKSDQSQSDHDVSGLRAGKLMAVTALCKILCSKRTVETVSDEILCRSYTILMNVFKESDELVLSGILTTGQFLFSIGLPKIFVLIPSCITSIRSCIQALSQHHRPHPALSPIEFKRYCYEMLATVLLFPITLSGSTIKGKTVF